MNIERIESMENRLTHLEDKLGRITAILTEDVIASTPAVEDSAITIPEGEDPPWLSKARGYLGIDEDDDEDKVLALAKDAGTPIESSETPWCAIFVNGILAQCGLETTGTMRARDFEDYGQECEERVGAIVVYRSHVGFVPEKGKILGGNQSDGVNIGEQRWYGKPIAYRFPEGYAV